MSKKPAVLLGAGCLALFGLPFLLAGLFVIGIGVKAIFTAAEISDWEVVDGQVETLRRGDSGSSVEAELAYNWNGENYTTSELSPYGMKEEGWESEMYAKLNKVRQRGSTVPVLVNPDNPSDAVLQPEEGYFVFIFPLIFGGVFALVGGGVIGAGIYGMRHSKKASKLQESSPGEPWRWRAEWVEGRVRAEQRFAVITVAAFAFFWNAISWTIAIMFLHSDEEKEWFLYLMVGLFPFIGLVLLGVLYKTWRKARILGKSAFVFSPEHAPFRRGGEVVGRIETNRVLPSRIARDLEIGLRFVDKSMVRSGKNTRTVEDVVWSKMAPAPHAVNIPGGTRMDFTLPVPRGLSDTEDPIPGGHKVGETEREWQIVLRGKGEAKDVDLNYAIPVYGEEEGDSGASDEDPENDVHIVDGIDTSHPLTLAELESVGVDRYVSGDGSVTYVRNGKGRAGIGGVTFFVGLVFVAIAWFGIGPETPVLAFMFGGAGVVASLIGLGVLTGRSALRVDFQKRQLVRMTKCLGIKRMKVLPFSGITGIEAITNGTVNNKPMYVLECKATESNKFRVLGLLFDSMVARKLAHTIESEVDAVRAESLR